MENSKTHYQPIENYGVIGDLRTVALVGINGSIDFMCFPHFDSPSIFTALLDCKKGGFFQIAPIDENVQNKQMYFPDTNILVTRFLFKDGIGEVTDFMPVASLYKKSVLIRKVSNIKGNITYLMRCCPRFNYAQSSHTAKIENNEILFKSRGPDQLCLRLKSTVPLTLKKKDGYAEFTLKAGEEAVFILELIKKSCRNESISNCKKFAESAFKQTHAYWKEWIAQSTYKGHWQEMVKRSALVLKLLISNNYGSIIAAPTFSLPEKIGGSKNWDYRFAWIRDAAFTVYSLVRIGYKTEAEAFMGWITKICKNFKKAALKTVYSFDGGKLLEETELFHLEGYKKSRPVRIGNAASKQIQLDIYGEFIDAIYLIDKHVSPISHDIWLALLNEMNWLAKNYKKKDRGIWEVRGKNKEFLHSRFMCWVAFDRMIKIGNKHSFPVPDDWIKIRDKIYNAIYKYFWNKNRKAFTQSKNSSEMDASLLLMPLIRFINPNDPQWISTLKNIEKDLVVDCLVYRYRPEEAKRFGLKKGEGTFSACSFWYIECLSRQGQLQKAEKYFDEMLRFANHLGLFSEQLGMQGEHLGNFPQAFTHLSLISAAFDLNKRLNKSKR